MRTCFFGRLALMYTLPMQPPEAVPIGTSSFSFAAIDGRITCFSNLEPYDGHDEADRGAMLLRIARFAENGIRRAGLQTAFGISRSTLKRAATRLRDRGEASFHAPRRGRGTSTIVGETAAEAERLPASGMRIAEVARELGIAPATPCRNCRKGFIACPDAGKQAPVSGTAAPEVEPEAAESAGKADLLDRSARDRRDREAPMGRGARDSAGRVAASTGAMAEAEARFGEPLPAVACGGVLAALPMLLREGLLDRTREFLALPKGCHGLAGVFLFPAFPIMARVRNPEALRHQSPGERGAIPGLDRCPEARTLRSRTRTLAADVQRVRDWQDTLAEVWLEDEGDVCATLSADGRVKVHSGRKGRLPKHFIARRKLCLPAAASCWINMLGGRPLPCLNKALDPTMTRALEQDVLPAPERLGLPGPDAPDPAADASARPALTLAFDREGWSPALFKRLARRGIAAIAWHRNFGGEAWPEAEFRTLQVPLHGPGATRHARARLAGKRIEPGNGLEVRQIRRLLDSGRQMPLVATDFRMPLEQAAGVLFSRWSQESFFKCMREEFDLDALAVHGLAEQDPEERVVNPAWRRLDSHARRLRQRLGTLRSRIADLSRGSSSGKARKTARQLKMESDALDAERETLKRQRSETPRHIRVADLVEKC